MHHVKLTLSYRSAVAAAATPMAFPTPDNTSTRQHCSWDLVRLAWPSVRVSTTTWKAWRSGISASVRKFDLHRVMDDVIRVSLQVTFIHVLARKTRSSFDCYASTGWAPFTGCNALSMNTTLHPTFPITRGMYHSALKKALHSWRRFIH